MEDVYDLLVVGAGPAGEVGAALAASFGRRVLIVERGDPGGAVTTTGGAPTKALRDAAVHLAGYRQRFPAGASPGCSVRRSGRL
jgi:NAD(P) transhydrogenase